MKQKLAAAVLLSSLIFSSIAFADSIGGPWLINANGWEFRIEIRQNGDKIFGTMKALNSNNPDTTITGHISLEGEISFRRDTPPIGPDGGDQEYKGFVFKGIEKNRHMAGTFASGIGKRHQFGWYGEYLGQ